MKIERRLMLRTFYVLVAAVLFAVAATFLPDNPYLRFQALDGTIYGWLRHDYERAHFDPRPVDVVILGSSRTARGIDPEVMEQTLRQAGHPATVYNTSVVGEGRNIQWVIFRQMLAAKQPKLVVISIAEHDFPWGHDSFRFVAPASEIWREAALGLHDSRKNLPYLPFRQLRLFAMGLAPQAFGMDATFDPQRYKKDAADNWAALHLGYKRTSDGQWVDINKPVPRAALLADEARNESDYHLQSKLPRFIRDIQDVDNRVYVDLIVREARKRHIQVVFLYLPGFHRGDKPIQNRAYYEKYGPIVDDTDLSEHDELYYDWSHLNPTGMTLASRRLGAAIAPLLPENSR